MHGAVLHLPRGSSSPHTLLLALCADSMPLQCLTQAWYPCGGLRSCCVAILAVTWVLHRHACDHICVS
jgi:hypothetical protein